MLLNRVSKYYFRKEWLLLMVALVLFSIAAVLNHKYEKPIIQLSKQDSAINLNKNLLSYVSLGNKRLITDICRAQKILIKVYG